MDPASELAAESAADLVMAGYATAVDRLRRLRCRLSPWERTRAVRRLDGALALLTDFDPPAAAERSACS